MKYPLASETWNNSEKEAAKKVIDSGFCTMGPITKKFEEEFCKKFNCKYAVFVNSGSSANLLAISAFLYKQNGVKFEKDDEIIVPAVSWSTTYYPVSQIGLKLVFVDVNLTDFNISIEEVKKAITPKTKAIIAVNLLGMPCDLFQLKTLCEENKIALIEDNCESMMASIGEKYCGTIGDVGTFSCFFSHHINTIEGGMITTDDEELYQILVCLRAHGWLRNLPDNNLVYNKSGNWFEDTWKFALPGYNVRPNEVFSAIGLEQMKKLDDLLMHRIENYNHLKQNMINGVSLQSYSTYQNIFTKSSSWFGFGFIANSYDRMAIIDHLMKNNIETRPIVAGNFTKNPVIKWLPHRIVGDLPNAKIIDEKGFFIGNNGEDITEQINYFIDIMNKLQ